MRSGFFTGVLDLDDTVSALAPRLLAYGLARTACRGIAEDIAQDALTALVRCWRRSGPPASPDAYVFAIAKRRAGRAVIRRALSAPLDALRGVAGDEPDAERRYQRRTEFDAVRVALRGLPRGDREALLLRAVAGLEYTQIATLLHASEAAVKMRISRARRRLAASLPEPLYGRRTGTA